MRKKLLWGLGISAGLLATALVILFFSLNDGFSANYYAKKAAEYLALGDRERAAQSLVLALRADPSRTDSRIKLASLYREAGETAQAEAILQDGIRRAGQSSACWLELARLYVSQGRLEAASQLLDTPTQGYLGLTIGQRRPRFALSKSPGSYRAPLRLTMTPETGTVCYYTLDGTVPDLSAPVWPGTLELGEGQHTLTMVAVRDDLPSPIFRGAYTVSDSLPAFSLAGEDLDQLILYLQALESFLAENGYLLP